MSRSSKTTTLSLLCAVRDAHIVAKSEKALLDTLVLRSRPGQDGSWSCYPSYRVLSLDTGYDEVTLQRAARKLQEKGLIRRRLRKHRSNVFFIMTERIEQSEIDEKARIHALKTEQYALNSREERGEGHEDHASDHNENFDDENLDHVANHNELLDRRKG